MRRFAAERGAGESFCGWLDRAGGTSALAADLWDLDHVPAPSEAPDFFVDYDELAPFSVEVSESECAT